MTGFPPHETKKPASTDEMIQDAVTRFAFNQNTNPSWRDPEGTRISGLSDELVANKALHNAHKNYKLFRDERMPNGDVKINDYGLLVGCLLPSEMTEASNLNVVDAVTKMRDAGKLFRIGKKTAFKCCEIKGKEQMKLCFTDHGCHDVIVEGTEGTLFLLINDTIVDELMLGELLRVAESGPSELERKRDMQPFAMASKIYDPNAPLKKSINNTEKFNLLTKELWYWDNIGSFTVVITTKASH